jgi:hypothetical protein
MHDDLVHPKWSRHHGKLSLEDCTVGTPSILLSTRVIGASRVEDTLESLCS